MKIIITIDDHFSIVEKILKQMKIIIMNELVINPNTHIIYCVFSLILDDYDDNQNYDYFAKTRLDRVK